MITIIVLTGVLPVTKTDVALLKTNIRLKSPISYAAHCKYFFPVWHLPVFVCTHFLDDDKPGRLLLLPIRWFVLHERLLERTPVIDFLPD